MIVTTQTRIMKTPVDKSVTSTKYGNPTMLIKEPSKGES